MCLSWRSWWLGLVGGQGSFASAHPRVEVLSGDGIPGPSPTVTPVGSFAVQDNYAYPLKPRVECAVHFRGIAQPRPIKRLKPS